jgi:hypothetical protein
METLEIIGAVIGNRLMLFGTKVQQRLSMSRTKDSQNQNGDNSLDGLVIDWHLATSEIVSNDFVEPVSNYEPTYAYA